jgi:hypothetical protein
MTKQYLTAEQITQEVIENWKKEHKKIFKYVTEDKQKTAYFKNPDVSAIEASSVIASTKPMQSNKLLAKACFLGGDTDVFEEPKYLLGLGKKLQGLVEVVEGELEEL